MFELPKIVLASASPRRAEILRTVGWPFEIRPVNIDESRHPNEPAAQYVTRLAQEKANAAKGVVAEIIVGADTTVVIDEHILEKPVDAEDAKRMLRLLNNRRHHVITGVAVIDSQTSAMKVAHQTTEVRFAAMSDEEIDWYVATGEPMDKAGAYAIQGKGSRLIEEVRGDYFNVVGLPVRLLYELMKDDVR